MVFVAAILSAQTRLDNSRAMDSILVKDWVPDSSLVVSETNIAKARFPAIDVHVHARGDLGDTPESLAAWVQIMDEAGVEKMIVLSEATGAKFDRLADLYQKNYPTRFQLWCGLDEQEFERADYPERAAAELERCYRKGGRGVGELSDKGWGIMGGIVAAYGNPPGLPRERRMHMDDPRLDLFWKKCAQLKIPVSLHVADHPSAWRPPDNHQERTPRYQAYNQYGSDVPTYETPGPARSFAGAPSRHDVHRRSLLEPGERPRRLEQSAGSFPESVRDILLATTKWAGSLAPPRGSSRNTKIACCPEATRCRREHVSGLVAADGKCRRVHPRSGLVEAVRVEPSRRSSRRHLPRQREAHSQLELAEAGCRTPFAVF